MSRVPRGPEPLFQMRKSLWLARTSPSAPGSADERFPHGRGTTAQSGGFIPALLLPGLGQRHLSAEQRRVWMGLAERNSLEGSDAE